MIFFTKVIRRSSLENCTRGQQESRFLSSARINLLIVAHHTPCLALPSKTLPTNCKARQTTASPPHSHPRRPPNINRSINHSLPIHPCPHRTLAPSPHLTSSRPHLSSIKQIQYPNQNKFSEIKGLDQGRQQNEDVVVWWCSGGHTDFKTAAYRDRLPPPPFSPPPPSTHTQFLQAGAALKKKTLLFRGWKRLWRLEYCTVSAGREAGAWLRVWWSGREACFTGMN